MLVSYKTIGRNIRAARKARGYTQEQTAELMKISVLHYGRLERGERPASLEQLAQVALVVDAPLAQLLSGCIEGETFGCKPHPDSQQLSNAVMRIAEGCSKDAQELMLALCQTVAAQDRKSEIKK